MTLAFVIPLRLVYVYVLNDFYHLGTTRDGLWIAGVLWRNDLSLTDPSAMASSPTASFFRTHFSPILLAPALLSHLLPIGPVPWLALFIGVVHASLTVGMFYLVLSLFREPSALRIAIATVLALAFAFNGNAMNAVPLPHSEIAIPAALILCLGFLVTGRPKGAIISLVVALLTREDAGFHAAAILGLALTARYFQTGSLQSTAIDALALRLAIGAACYSIFILILQRGLYGSSGLFWNHYVGDPPYAHLNAALLSTRARLYFSDRAYIYVPFLVVLGWGAVTRNLLLPLGFLAYVPWLLLHFTATGYTVGTLAYYYGFPFIVSLAWPLAAVLWKHDGQLPEREVRRTLLFQAVVIASTLAGHVCGQNVVYATALEFQAQPAVAQASIVDAFTAQIQKGHQELGRMRVDTGILGLAPRFFTHRDWLEGSLPNDGQVDSVVFFDPGYLDSLAWATMLEQNLEHYYGIPGTRIAVASNRSLDRLSSFRPFLTPMNPLWRRMRPTSITEVRADGFFVSRNSPPGPMNDGPHMSWKSGLCFSNTLALPVGGYIAEFSFSLSNINNAAEPVASFELDYPWAPQARQRWTLRERDLRELERDGDFYKFPMSFTVTGAAAGQAFNLRLVHEGNADIKLVNVRLLKGSSS